MFMIFASSKVFKIVGFAIFQVERSPEWLVLQSFQDEKASKWSVSKKSNES